MVIAGADVVTVAPSAAAPPPFAAEMPLCGHLGTAVARQLGCVSVSAWEGPLPCPVFALMA